MRGALSSGRLLAAPLFVPAGVLNASRLSCSVSRRRAAASAMEAAVIGYRAFAARYFDGVVHHSTFTKLSPLILPDGMCLTFVARVLVWARPQKKGDAKLCKLL
jgi:hypothetical protein